MSWTREEEDHLSDLLMNENLSWNDIREMMLAEGYEDRGERAYQSKAYRMSKEAPPEPETLEDLHYNMYRYLRDEPRSLRQICDKFDKSPKFVRNVLTEMQGIGFNVIEAKAGAIIPTKAFPKVQLPDVSIADMLGDEVNILLIGDNHSGSNKSQPTQMNRTIQYAAEEFGVTKVFHHGDFTAGIYGYRGQEQDLIPAARPVSRKMGHLATARQVDMADCHLPKIPGLKYYMIGGNHDWWHVVNTGLDPLRMLCDRRSDIRYLGYDMAKIPLTDKTYMRMWHPTGGVAYAKSYKVQKAIEAEGLEALKQAISKEESPHVSIITAGHWHINGWVPSSPMYGGSVGCFEGQTNYLKRKALAPDIGGVIMQLRFGDDGRITDIGYRWIPCTEIKDDWNNWPVPEIEELDFDQEDLEVIFEIE